MSKKNLLMSGLIAATLALSLVSCGDDDIIDETGPKPQTQEQSFTITCSDETIGNNQTVILTTDYSSGNPNLLLTWYDNETRLNAIARSTTDYTWTAKGVGLHTIKVIITDRDKVIEIKKNFEVIATDLGDVILGDKKSKVIRSLSTYKDKSSYFEYGSTNDLNKCYFSSDNDDPVVIKIENNRTYKWVSYENTTSYYLALTSFQEAVRKAQIKYGEPLVSELPTSTEFDDYVAEGVLFYKGQKSYKAVFSLRNNHTVTLHLAGSVNYGSYWSVNGEIVVMPESYIIVTEIE